MEKEKGCVEIPIPKTYTQKELQGLEARLTKTIINRGGNVIHEGAKVVIKNVVRGKGLIIKTEECPHCHQSSYITGVSRKDLRLICLPKEDEETENE